MPLINGIPLKDRSADVGNSVLTQQPQPITGPVPAEKTTIVYDGKSLQRIPAGNLPTVQDSSNNPSYFVIAGIVLSGNAVVPVKDEKVIAESQIIDGVTVFEHISRKSAEIDFDFTIFPPGVITGEAGGTQKTVYNNVTTFNQQVLNQFWNSIFLPNSVQQVQNTYLNGLGIQEIIVKSVSIAPRPGSANISVKMKAFENQPGTLFVGFTNSNFIDSPVNSTNGNFA